MTKSGLAKETKVTEVSPSENAMTVKADGSALAVEELIGKKRKKQNKNRAAADNDKHERETRGEQESSGSKMKAKKKPKNSQKAKGGVNSLDNASGLNNDDADRSQLDNVKDDSDWLRARTNRILDLVDDEQVRTQESLPSVSEDRDSSSGGSQYENELQVSASSGAQHDTERWLANARLFIRNLPYSASEADIQIVFSKYGKVTEVSR